MPTRPKAPQIDPLTPRQEVAARIAQAIFAGPAGADLLEAEDSTFDQVAKTAFEFADRFFAVGGAS